MFSNQFFVHFSTLPSSYNLLLSILDTNFSVVEIHKGFRIASSALSKTLFNKIDKTGTKNDFETSKLSDNSLRSQSNKNSLSDVSDIYKSVGDADSESHDCPKIGLVTLDGSSRIHLVSLSDEGVRTQVSIFGIFTTDNSLHPLFLKKITHPNLLALYSYFATTEDFDRASLHPDKLKFLHFAFDNKRNLTCFEVELEKSWIRRTNIDFVPTRDGSEIEIDLVNVFETN